MIQFKKTPEEIYFFRYYMPLRLFHNANRIDREFAEKLWSFKDGDINVFWYFRDILDEFVSKLIMDGYDNLLICPVPRSRNDLINLTELCAAHAARSHDEYGVNFTADCITRPVDISSGHLGCKSTNQFDSLKFDFSGYYDYTNILLLDDISTTGKTLCQIAQLLPDHFNVIKFAFGACFGTVADTTT